MGNVKTLHSFIELLKQKRSDRPDRKARQTHRQDRLTGKTDRLTHRYVRQARQTDGYIKQAAGLKVATNWRARRMGWVGTS